MAISRAWVLMAIVSSAPVLLMMGCAYDAKMAAQRYADVEREIAAHNALMPAAATPAAPPLMKSVQDFTAVHPSIVEADSSELASFFADKAATTRPAARMMIYNGRLTIAVADVEVASRTAEAVAERLGGYVQKVETRAITIRVPAVKFREAVDLLGGIGPVTEKNIEAQDVTEEFIDVEIRLKNARAMLKRLEELLAKCDDVKATLEVEKELNRVRGEIERLEGRLKYLSSQIAFSTITVQWSPIRQTVTRGKRPALPFPWLQELGVETLIRR